MCIYKLEASSNNIILYIIISVNIFCYIALCCLSNLIHILCNFGFGSAMINIYVGQVSINQPEKALVEDITKAVV